MEKNQNELSLFRFESKEVLNKNFMLPSNTFCLDMLLLRFFLGVNQ